LLLKSLNEVIEGWKGTDVGVSIPIPRLRFLVKEETCKLSLGFRWNMGKFQVFFDVVSPVGDSAKRCIRAVEFVQLGDLQARNTGRCG
jgi:hypothetical protein